MQKFLILICFLIIGTTSVVAQPKFAIKTNLLYDAMTSPNLGVEFGLGRKTSIEVSGNYNFWMLQKSTNGKFKHILVQPEFRYWLCERFNGHFFGLHAHYGNYNVGGLDLPFGLTKNSLAKYRYRGDLYGVGVAYGYQWVFKKRWALEGSLGAGYAHLIYDKFNQETDGDKLGKFTNNYFGVTKASISLIFFIK